MDIQTYRHAVSNSTIYSPGNHCVQPPFCTGLPPYIVVALPGQYDYNVRGRPPYIVVALPGQCDYNVRGLPPYIVVILPGQSDYNVRGQPRAKWGLYAMISRTDNLTNVTHHK